MSAPRLRAALLAAALLPLVACDAPSRPVAPRLAPPEIAVATDHVPLSSGPTLVSRFQALYADPKGPEATRAFALYEAIRLARTPAEACGGTLDLVGAILDAYRTGALYKGLDTDLLPAMQSVIQGLNDAYCPTLLGGKPFPLAALTADGAALVVRAAVGGQVATGNRFAGVSIPAGALNSDALITISRRLTSSAKETEGVLNTSLGSGPFYDISAFPNQGRLRAPLVVGLVQVGPYEAVKNIDVIIGHRGDGSSTPDVPGPTTCPVTLIQAVARMAVPAYLRPSASVTWPPTSGDVSPELSADAAPMAAAFGRDSSGTAGGCGTASGLSPFGFIEVYRPGFNARGLLTASAAGCRRFTITNRSQTQDLVAIWRAIPSDANRVGQVIPVPVFVGARASVPVEVPAGTGELRLSYGPVTLESVRASACS